MVPRGRHGGARGDPAARRSCDDADEVFITSSHQGRPGRSTRVDDRTLPARTGHRPRRRGLRPATRRRGWTRDRQPGQHPRCERGTQTEDDGDWEWRRRIRANPHCQPHLPHVVGVVGRAHHGRGSASWCRSPAPAGSIVFVGIGVLASEFEWAQRLLDFGKEQARGVERLDPAQAAVGQGPGRPGHGPRRWRLLLPPLPGSRRPDLPARPGRELPAAAPARAAEGDPGFRARQAVRLFFGEPARAPGRVAQLVRAFASHARGQGFESLHVHHAGHPAPLSPDSGVLLRPGATVGGWAEHS